jgi:hypothetical protein
LVHNHTGLAGKRAVRSRLALLIGAHSPTGVLRIGSDGDHVGVIGRELALSTTLLKSRRLNGKMLSQVLKTIVTVTVLLASDH